MNNFEFNIILDDLYINDKTKANNLLSLVNGYEDGKWDYDKFNNYLSNSLKYTALTENERNKLIHREATLLGKAFRNVRKDVNSLGGEVAEILLYGIMHDYYKALPIVPKIFHKQNSNDYVKGADSIHIIIDKNNDVEFWYGEAKFYNKFDKTLISSAINSIIEMLNKDKLKKENHIIVYSSDLQECIKNRYSKNSSELIDIICYMLENSFDEMKKRIHVPILLLYECDITKIHSELTDEYKKQILLDHNLKYATYFEEQKKSNIK